MRPRSIKNIESSTKFKRSFQSLPASIQEKADERDQMFRRNAFDPRLKTHKLGGSLKGYWSYSIDYQYRVLFRFDGSDKVVYFDIGDHRVYR
jgi:mRNA-degrading endonuclease YafQ of YafQ-DinJ toxin-antitoxin module